MQTIELIGEKSVISIDCAEPVTSDVIAHNGLMFVPSKKNKSQWKLANVSQSYELGRSRRITNAPPAEEPVGEAPPTAPETNDPTTTDDVAQKADGQANDTAAV